ncbi:MAG: FAD-binding protein, partial [Pseudomonadota bacterium]
MLKDLNHHRGAPAQRAADIAIAGGGIAGLILATRLARAGLRVILLESGGRVAQEPDPVLSDVAFLRQPYRGALEGRARGLGGTSVKWGGALIPFHPSNFRPRPGWPRWPFGFEALAPYLSEAEALFRLGAGAYEESGGAERGFRLREAKWPRFGRRNLARLLRREIAAGDGPEIWLNAAARRVIMAEGRVAGVEAVSLTGARLTVRAPTVVLAAGALETTRLLLLLDAHCEAEGRSPLAGRAHLGRALQDHLSLAAATIDAADPARLNAFAGFRFHQGAIWAKPAAPSAPISSKRGLRIMP